MEHEAPDDMIKNQFEVEVLVNGKPLKEYIHKGVVYIEGKKGSNFSLRLRNNSYQRKLFVPSIDGLSVMNGEDASPDSGGYIVRPYSSITIDGWRLSDQEVAEFYFSSPKDSYRKRMKRGNNIGVIGCMIFDEYIPPQNFAYFSTSGGGGGSGGNPFHFGNGTITCSASASSASLRSMNASNDLGTGFGREKRSEVVSVEFEKTGSPTTIEIFYNTREQLQNLGVSMKEAVYIAPQAFPGQFCKRPRN